MFDQIYLMLYNLFFTSLPPLALGIYDRIAPAKVLLDTPKLYERGSSASVYQPHSFWITMAEALYQSIVIFFLTEAVCEEISHKCEVHFSIIQATFYFRPTMTPM